MPVPRHHLHDTLERDEPHVESPQGLAELGHEVRRLERPPLGIARVVRPADARVGQLHVRSVRPRGELGYDRHGDLLHGRPVHAELEVLPDALLAVRPAASARPRVREARAVARREAQAGHAAHGRLEVRLRVARDDVDGVVPVGAQALQREARRGARTEAGRAEDLPLEVLPRRLLHD